MGATLNEINTLLGGGPNNSGFQATPATLQTPTTSDQAGQATGQAQDAVSQQANLAQQLGAQNGIGNQSQVFGQQQQLAGALQSLANGQGPNPAQAQLAQNTAANTANQASLMAGQRGANQNVGLIARQAGQVGAQNQQQSVGQAATLQAQQQIAAQQNLMQQQQNEASLAGNQVSQQQGAVAGLNSAAQGLQGNILNSVNAQNTANVANQANVNNANASLANTNAGNSASTVGGGLNQIAGAGAKIAGFAKGGEVGTSSSRKHTDHTKAVMEIFHPEAYALGGPVSYNPPAIAEGSPQGRDAAEMAQAQSKASSDEPLNGALAGGQGEAMGADAAMVAADGAQVPGTPEVQGDSPKNDTVPAMLSPGEIVIPNHILQSEDAPEKAKAFVAALLEKHGKSFGKDPEGDFHSALKEAIKGRSARGSK